MFPRPVVSDGKWLAGACRGYMVSNLSYIRDPHFQAVWPRTSPECQYYIDSI